jgi:predicted nucleic acid-binding protein
LSLERKAKEIERIVNELADEAPPELSMYLKNEFEKFLPQFLGGSVKAEMRVVLDASQAVAEVLAYAKRGDSVLLRLAREPFLKIYAPPEIVPEVQESLREIASKKKIDAENLLGIWKAKLLPFLVLQRPENLGAWFKGTFIMERRDPKDIPYVALSFDFEMHGVVTRDLDILEQPQVRTWKMGKVKHVVTVMKKGSLMFMASSEVPVSATGYLISVRHLVSESNIQSGQRCREGNRSSNLWRG